MIQYAKKSRRQQGEVALVGMASFFIGACQKASIATRGNVINPNTNLNLVTLFSRRHSGFHLVNLPPSEFATLNGK